MKVKNRQYFRLMQSLSFAGATVSDIVTSSWIQITTLKQIKSHDSHVEGVIQYAQTKMSIL